MISRAQRGVAIGMAAGAALSALILCCPTRWFIAPLPLELSSRLAFAARADALAMLWLLAAIANVARRRFFSAADIDGSGFAPASDRLRIEAAVLQNTLEQTVLAAVLYPALVSLPAQSDVMLVPQLLTLFCLGRLAFWIGYRFGARWRAFGFALTFYPTVFGYVLLAINLGSG
jgi:hypothetical protein